MEAREDDDAARVVVIDLGFPACLVVDRVTELRSVDEDRIEDGAQIETTVKSGAIAGVVRDAEGGSGVTLALDVARLAAKNCALARAALMRRVLSGMLSEAGYVVVTARNGREALEVTAREKPDAITLDVNMPEMDGLTFLAQLMDKSPRWISSTSRTAPSRCACMR